MRLVLVLMGLQQLFMEGKCPTWTVVFDLDVLIQQASRPPPGNVMFILGSSPFPPAGKWPLSSLVLGSLEENSA